MKIIFLCTSNTCRSPIAEGLFNKKAKKLNMDIASESAGTGAFYGDRASENAIEIMKEKGVDISSHRSRRISEYMADEYDYFICMTNEHKQQILSFVPENKIMLLGDEIWDPYGDGKDIYRLCADKIDRETDRLIDFFSKPQISPMRAEDIKEIAEIEKECFSSPWSEKALESELDNENAVFFTAKEMGKTVGYMGMHTVMDECYIANIAVRKEHRRKGIGKSLLLYAQKAAEERSCSFISLEVRVSNEGAIFLYSSQGYEKMGERKNFYTNPTENALIMTKEIKYENFSN